MDGGGDEPILGGYGWLTAACACRPRHDLRVFFVLIVALVELWVCWIRIGDPTLWGFGAMRFPKLFGGRRVRPTYGREHILSIGLGLLVCWCVVTASPWVVVRILQW